MEAPVLVFVQNEFYELHNPAEVPISDHPYPQLLPFKTVMAANTSYDRMSVVFKWPSYRSLAYFDSDKLHILPDLDQECLILQSAASRIVKHRIEDPVNLCYDQGYTIEPWVHNFDQATNLMSEIDIPDDHSNHVQRNRIRNDHFYVLSWTCLPRHIAGRIKGFPRVARVCRLEGQDIALNVEVRVPSRKSVDRFLQSVSATLPDFDQVFSINDQSATAFLRRIVPIQTCYQLRRYRYFWFNVHQERIHNSQPSTSGAFAKLFGCVTKNSG